MASSAIGRNFKIGYKNIQGLHYANECKIGECTKELFSDIEILSETWGCTCEKVFDGYDLLAEIKPKKYAGVKKGRKSGGTIVLGKKYLKNLVQAKETNNFVGVEISRELFENANKNLFILCGYIHDATSKYHDPDAFENLACEISKLCDENTPMIITGDLNGRTGVLNDYYEDHQLGNHHDMESVSSIPLPLRKNCDKSVNNQGKSIIELCHIFNLKILNGRSKGDPMGNFTYNDSNLGASTIDYSICTQNFYENVNNFMVLPQNELSDHSKIVTELKETPNMGSHTPDNYKWEILQNKFIWDENQKTHFINYLENDNDRISDIKQRIEAGLIGSTGNKIQELFNQAAQNVLIEKHEKNLQTKTIGIKEELTRKDGLIKNVIT